MSTTQTLSDRIGTVECRICRKIVNRALARGWLVAVSDGEEVVVGPSDDAVEIADAIGHTEETYLSFFSKDERPKAFGRVWLIHGNQEDLVSDNTDTDELNSLLDGVSS